MNNKERRLKRTCDLAGVEYHSPVTRWYNKTTFAIGRWWYDVVHVSVGYLIWGAVKIKILPFGVFEQWCFCRKKSKYYE